VSRIATFDDWTDLFRSWQREIDYDIGLLGDYSFETKLGELESPEVQFGAFAGEPKWERLLDVPDQRIRDALLNYVIYQGDTEFASVEQQRLLVATAPSAYDLQSIARIMREEMRHGWQMSFLLVTYFGSSGRLEAEKLLQRRAFQHSRLLGAFNQPVEHWLDFFVYAEFQDRDGKFQLRMLSRSAFAPLARSMGPMLKEESYHLGTGHSGLKRIVQAGRIPTATLQRYFNKWVPACYDLFGTDHSTSAEWGYTWGIKGRYDERPELQADKQHLNELARAAYVEECQRLVTDLNRLLPPDAERLRLPDTRFNRRIGDSAGRPFTIDGTLMPEAGYSTYLTSMLPNAADAELLQSLTREGGWIVPRGLPEPDNGAAA
jgi:benzoyl-CoA 2,3-dioxygenase component B